MLGSMLLLPRVELRAPGGCDEVLVRRLWVEADGVLRAWLIKRLLL